MPRIFLLCLLVALSVAGFPLAVISAETSPAPTIVVEADGKVTATPDQATLLVEVETQATGAAAAAQENARRSDDLLRALKKVLTPEDKVQTLSFRLIPMHAPKDKTQPPEVKGYQALHRFKVEVYDAGRLGTVIDTSLKSGASQINGPYWGHSRLEELRQQAAVNALENARRLAVALAQAAGLKIKGVEKISTAVHILPLRPGGEVFMAAQAAPPTPIEVGEEEIRGHIQAVFQLSP